MSSLPKASPLESAASDANQDKSTSKASSRSTDKQDTIPESRSTSDLTISRSCPATRSASHQPSEYSDATLLDGFYDGGVLDNASSVTFQDVFPWHKGDVHKSMQRIPSTIVPALLQGIDHTSPSQRSLDEDRSPELAEISSHSRDVPLRYSMGQKEKWKCTDDTDRHGLVRSPSPEFRFESPHNSVEDWVVHSRPILQEYADRQTSLPLGRRLEVSIDEPPRFILGAIQLLVNRDKKECTRPLGPQLIENFVDIELWAKEYFRSRYDAAMVDGDVPALLTIVINNFYEGQVQLIDRLVEFALENMRISGRRSLGVEDFAFGFDFKMSQDLPFYVETSSRIRKPLPIAAVEVNSISEPVTTSSGRQVKPTARAQAASEEAHASARGGQKKDAPQVTDGALNTEKSGDSQAKPRTVRPLPQKITTERMKNRPIQSSNLRLTPILPRLSSTAGTTPSQSNESDPVTSSSAIPEVSSSSGPILTTNSPFTFKIKLPPPGSSASTIVATDPSSRVNLVAVSETSKKKSGLGLRSRSARSRGSRNGCHGPERGDTLLPPNEVAPKAITADATELSPTVRPVDKGNAEASDAAKPPAESPRPDYPLRSAVGETSREAGIGALGDGPLARQGAHTSQPLLKNDPGHPRRKKRKLDEFED